MFQNRHVRPVRLLRTESTHGAVSVAGYLVAPAVTVGGESVGPAGVLGHCIGADTEWFETQPNVAYW